MFDACSDGRLIGNSHAKLSFHLMNFWAIFVNFEIESCNLLALLSDLVFQLLEHVSFFCLFLDKHNVFLLNLILVFLLSLFMNAEIHLEYLSLFLQSLHLRVHWVAEPHIIKLRVTHVANIVSHRVQSCNLALIPRALVTYWVATALAIDFLRCKTTDLNQAVLILADGALITGSVLLCICIENSWQTEQILG